ncbi:hypothetical protein ACK8N7_01705 [Streptomyces griseobrunneus]
MPRSWAAGVKCVHPMELGIVHRLFGTALDDDGRPLYSVVTCAAEAGELTTDADFTVNIAHGPEALESADTVLVPAAVEDYGPQRRDQVPNRCAGRSPTSRRTPGWPRSARARSFWRPSGC